MVLTESSGLRVLVVLLRGGPPALPPYRLTALPPYRTEDRNSKRTWRSHHGRPSQVGGPAPRSFLRSSNATSPSGVMPARRQPAAA